MVALFAMLILSVLVIEAKRACIRRVPSWFDECWVGGVCAGIAWHYGLSETSVRMPAVLLIIFSGGLALVAYAALWYMLPEGSV